MKRANYILIFVFLISLGCSNKIIEKENKTWNQISGGLKVESLVNFLIEFPNTDKKDFVYGKLDSLIGLNQQISLVNIAIEPYPDNGMYPIFVNTNEDTGDYYIQERNTYLLTLGKNGLTRNKQPIEISVFSNDLKTKFSQFDTSENSTQREIKEIKYFGFVLVSKITTVLDITEDMNKVNWDAYISTIRQVFSVYKTIWNDKSIEIWDTKFENLETKKKEALTKMYPFEMELNFTKRTFSIK
ncbi:hypothetical protein D1614_17760 [Maribellus luteus]|uniref:Lipoprotein n=1 Tax=Maribellus luteus TaxID=2305463 RepID=A0A399SX91_9BACT|nr:hypothetical protein [Maribellus luteus]RIJ46771.1 hypothetical protein D1614_17760 [Maribellus luteus]